MSAMGIGTDVGFQNTKTNKITLLDSGTNGLVKSVRPHSKNLEFKSEFNLPYAKDSNKPIQKEIHKNILSLWYLIWHLVTQICIDIM